MTELRFGPETTWTKEQLIKEFKHLQTVHENTVEQMWVDTLFELSLESGWSDKQIEEVTRDL